MNDIPEVRTNVHPAQFPPLLGDSKSQTVIPQLSCVVRRLAHSDTHAYAHATPQVPSKARPGSTFETWYTAPGAASDKRQVEILELTEGTSNHSMERGTSHTAAVAP